MLNIPAWRWRVMDGRLTHVVDSGGAWSVLLLSFSALKLS